MNGRVVFGLGLPPDLVDIDRLLPQARVCDAAGLDVVSIPDHPNFAGRVDAYAAIGMVLGATSQLSAAVNLTNIGIRPAPLLARTMASLSALSHGRVVLGVGAGSLWQELARLGVPTRSPAEAVQLMEETILVVRALTGGGPPVDFAGLFYQLRGAEPSVVAAPAIWTGSQGPKSLAITGRLADGWIPAHAADWQSSQVAAWRPRIDEAAVAAGRDPADIATIYNFGGEITDRAVARTRDDDGQWLGGNTDQWIAELTSAVVDFGAAGVFYLGYGLSDIAIGRWIHEIVPAVREAIAESNPRTVRGRPCGHRHRTASPDQQADLAKGHCLNDIRTHPGAGRYRG